MARYGIGAPVLIGALVVAGGMAWVRAGSLTPPTGAVAPTMRTLNEIYGVAAGDSPCGPCRWTSRQLNSAGPTQLAVGSGVVRGIIVSPCACGVAGLFDSPTTDVTGRPVITEVVHDINGSTAGNSSLFIPLEVGFTNGLVYAPVSGPARGRVTIIYRVD